LPRSRLLAAFAAAAVASSLVAPAAIAKTTITMSGSTSVYPLAVALAKSYVSANKGKVGFRILQGGSDIGINDVSHGRVTVGNASRDPLPGTDPGGLTFTKIARDGVCVITNPKNPVSNLSQEQIQAIFSGRVRDWGDVPGAKATGSIDVITRTAASGTADAFQNIFMGPDLRVAASAQAKSSNGLVNQTVRSDESAIGFVSFDFVAGTNPVGYAGVPCTLRNAKSGQYGGVRNFWMVTRGAPTGATKTYLSWVKKSPAAKRIISTHWIALG
jgi:phosphate transport system substrate-binding protein